MKTVRIFRTNVSKDQDAIQLTASLSSAYPDYAVNFDLNDEDNILRIEAQQATISETDIVRYVTGLGYSCEHII